MDYVPDTSCSAPLLIVYRLVSHQPRARYIGTGFQRFLDGFLIRRGRRRFGLAHELRWNLPHVLDLDGGRVGANRNVEIRTFHLQKPRVLISVESSPLWRSKYSRKKPPLNHVFTLAILIHSRGGDEEMYIVETLAKNRRLYPGEGKGCKTIGRELKRSKASVKKRIRGKETSQRYKRRQAVDPV